MLFNIPPYSSNRLGITLFPIDAKYNDPSLFINLYLSNRTNNQGYSGYDNVAQYNGGYGGFKPYIEENDVQLLMEQAINCTNQHERKILYEKIQKLLIERDFP